MLRAPFVLIINLLSLLRYLWSSFWFKVGYFFRRKKKLYLRLDLPESYSFGRPGGLAALFQKSPSFLEIRNLLERVQDDETIEGIIIEPEGTALGPARLADLGEEIDSVRNAGKHVVAHSRMPMMRDYILMTSADDLLMSPAGRLYTFGLRFDQYFGADALERLGVIPQFIHIGAFKTASHRFLHDESTQPQSLMMESLYDTLMETYNDRIAGRRQIPPEQAERIFSEAPYEARTARRAGFIDAEIFRESLDEWLSAPDEVAPVGFTNMQGPSEAATLGQGEGEEPTTEPELTEPLVQKVFEVDAITVDADKYMKATPSPYQWRPLFRRKKTFGTLDLSGMIVMPDMSVPGQSGAVIDPDEVVPVLKRARNDARTAGVILHINSPGGSALASDILWQAIEEVRRTKPVVAYCSDVAASGGYYLASGAHEIVARRETITGSIGVIMGKMSAPGVPQKLGINVESVHKHAADTFTSLVDPLGDEMIERLSEDARSFYRRFLQRVGQARGIPKRRLHRYARGRVYSGEDAYRRGLVDELGGFPAAVERLAELTEMDADTDIAFFPHTEADLRGLLRGSLVQATGFQSKWLDVVREPAIFAELLRRDPVLALMPWRPVFE
ncbi:MAG: signal peptide peptidase SppA [Myxococcota bacterium]